MLYRPRYTADNIRAQANNLPGFNETGDVFCILNNYEHTLWQPVLSATVVSRFDSGLHILTGNRTSTGNETHVNVASTPTMRVPYPDARSLANEHITFCLDGQIEPLRPFVSESLTPSVARLPNNADVLGAKVGNLLSLKLDLGPTLESAKKPIGRTSLARCTVGFSYLDDDPSGEPLYEPLVMFGAVVGLNEAAAQQVPEETRSYSHLGWVPIEQYAHGVKTRTLLEVIPSANPKDELEVCVRGLCNATSSAIVGNEVEIQNHLTENGIIERL